MLEFDDAEKKQYESNRKYWKRWLETVQKDIDRLPNQPTCTPQNQQANDDADDRVSDGAPCNKNDSARGNHSQ
jgi:hypothetical protein